MIQNIIHKLLEYASEVQYGCEQLYEFASPLGLVRKKIKSLSEPIIEHIAKVLLFKEDYPNSVDHWEKEIYAFLTSCMKLRIQHSNKYPDEKQLKSWILSNYSSLEDMEGLKFYLAGKYKKTNISDQELYTKIMKVLDRILPSLAKRSLTLEELDHIMKGEN